MTVLSAGSERADQINRTTVQAMAEDGIDITADQPKILNTEAVQDSDVVINMGCGRHLPDLARKRCECWHLDDPAGQSSPLCTPFETT